MVDRLSTAFVLGYHGCDERVAEKLLQGEPFKPSSNDYDWLGRGIYFWEKNPERGLDFAKELSGLKRSSVQIPSVVGAIIDLGLCMDLTTKSSIDQLTDSFRNLETLSKQAGVDLPENHENGLLRKLDCAVVNLVHKVRESVGDPSIDTVRGIFTEGEPIYPGAGFLEKTHVQICVRNPQCIKGVFKV